MIGAIAGDIIGSRFEFNNTHDKDFTLITDECDFTDDTICTVAVADAIMNNNCDYRASLQKWCRAYPYPMGGYGASFARWIMTDDAQPYDSFGNGAAMRVSPVAWLFDTEEEVLRQAEASAVVSHSHEEGIKGAQAVALAIFRLRQSKRLINVYDVAQYFYGKDFDKHLQKPFVFDETCQGCVPVCLSIVCHAVSYSDAVRRIVSRGGDTDTTGAIVGSIAEAIYRVPASIEKPCIAILPSRMIEIIEQFKQARL